MEKKEKIDNAEQCHNLLGESNHIFFHFSLLYYVSLLMGILIEFLLMQGVTDIIIFWGTATVIICQLIALYFFEDGPRYGYFTLIMSYLHFSFMNIRVETPQVLFIFIPVCIMSILYLDKKVSGLTYAVWIVNIAAKFFIAIGEGQIRGNVLEFEWILFVCAMVIVALGIVTALINKCYQSVIQNLCNENKLHRKLYRQSTVDSSTELLNRNAYNLYLAEFSPTDKNSVCCIYFDVNGLHEYNNTYGHQEGDKMLNMVADEIKRSFLSDRKYRVGGDEFVVIYENTDFNTVLAALNEFKGRMKEHQIYVATGVEWRDEDMHMDEMIKQADKKMYQNKEQFYRGVSEDKGNKTLYDRVAL